MKRAVVFSPEAQDDLRRLFIYIAKHSGLERALPNLGRIETHCMRLYEFPHRGTRRDDLLPGPRTIGFERRATICFDVAPDVVAVVRVLYGGRSLEAAFKGRH